MVSGKHTLLVATMAAVGIRPPSAPAGTETEAIPTINGCFYCLMLVSNTCVLVRLLASVAFGQMVEF